MLFLANIRESLGLSSEVSEPRTLRKALKEEVERFIRSLCVGPREHRYGHGGHRRRLVLHPAELKELGQVFLRCDLFRPPLGNLSGLRVFHLLRRRLLFGLVLGP
jgi:hypothetical protein